MNIAEACKKLGGAVPVFCPQTFWQAKDGLATIFQASVPWGYFHECGRWRQDTLEQNGTDQVKNK